MDEFWRNEAKWRIQDPGSGWAHRAGLGRLLHGQDPALVVCLTDPSWKGGAANEEIMHRIWDAFGTLVEINKRLAKHSEGCYQSELARIEKQPKSRPVLFQFPNKDDREFFTKPWLQVLMCIARTQVPEDRQHRCYKSTTQQQAAWDRLRQAAREEINGPHRTKTPRQAATPPCESVAARISTDLHRIAGPGLPRVPV
ncbi:hypothetical protein N7448_011470 [Penicillium atrosanguineum]|nr:hypothetical protein N7448_011092 [Penicillium atrosanguineum]KAJ5117838.1 hypothetical protein N7448_011470 [Penicillium atrosanguineum]